MEEKIYIIERKDGKSKKIRATLDKAKEEAKKFKGKLYENKDIDYGEITDNWDEIIKNKEHPFLIEDYSKDEN